MDPSVCVLHHQHRDRQTATRLVIQTLAFASIHLKSSLLCPDFACALGSHHQVQHSFLTCKLLSWGDDVTALQGDSCLFTTTVLNKQLDPQCSFAPGTFMYHAYSLAPWTLSKKNMVPHSWHSGSQNKHWAPQLNHFLPSSFAASSVPGLFFLNFPNSPNN